MIRTSGVTALVLIAGCSTASPTASAPAAVDIDRHTVLRTVPATSRSSLSPHRASRSRVVIDGAAAWASTGAARAVAFCESGQDNSARSHTGKYRGKWQIGPNEWRDWGGLKYAPSPELATEAEQDAVAYRGYLARGWSPWTCARIVGLI